MELTYDQEADAVYIRLRQGVPYSYGVDLDDHRRIDYGADRYPIGIELLSVSQGVDLTDLPVMGAIAGLLVQWPLSLRGSAGTSSSAGMTLTFRAQFGPGVRLIQSDPATPSAYVTAPPPYIEVGAPA